MEGLWKGILLTVTGGVQNARVRILRTRLKGGMGVWRRSVVQVQVQVGGVGRLRIMVRQLRHRPIEREPLGKGQGPRQNTLGNNNLDGWYGARDERPSLTVTLS